MSGFTGYSRIVDSPVTLVELMEIAALWGVHPADVVIEEVYEVGGSGTLEISYTAPPLEL